MLALAGKVIVEVGGVASVGDAETVRAVGLQAG
jgi:hypothetical protein